MPARGTGLVSGGWAGGTQSGHHVQGGSGGAGKTGDIKNASLILSRMKRSRAPSMGPCV